jgi:hypothetical protein
MCSNEIKEVGLLCKEICQQTKKIVEDTKYRSAGYSASKFCGTINCLSNSQKKKENWFRCEQSENDEEAVKMI